MAKLGLKLSPVSGGFIATLSGWFAYARSIVWSTQNTNWENT